MKKPVIAVALACSFLLPTGLVLAAEQEQERERIQAEEHEQIYGSQLMTEQERNKYRARIRAAKTQEERQEIRMQHHEQMRLRAQEQGLSLPETPPLKGGGVMQGDGMMRGSGMGGGKGKNR